MALPKHMLTCELDYTIINNKHSGLYPQATNFTSSTDFSLTDTDKKIISQKFF